MIDVIETIRGNNTQNQDQFIIPVNFRIIKIIVNVVKLISNFILTPPISLKK